MATIELSAASAFIYSMVPRYRMDRILTKVTKLMEFDGWCKVLQAPPGSPAPAIKLAWNLPYLFEKKVPLVVIE